MFSSSFFNFQAGQPPGIVSRWIWLYWVVTIALTAIVLVAWWSFSRFHSRKIPKSPAEELKVVPTPSSLYIGDSQMRDIFSQGPMERYPSVIDLEARDGSFTF